jgi:hypothetical protein
MQRSSRLESAGNKTGSTTAVLRVQGLQVALQQIIYHTSDLPKQPTRPAMPVADKETKVAALSLPRFIAPQVSQARGL